MHSYTFILLGMHFIFTSICAQEINQFSKKKNIEKLSYPPPQPDLAIKFINQTVFGLIQRWPSLRN